LDLFDRRILEVLGSGEARSFQEILSKAGFSHNTLRQHLDQLIVKGLVERRKEPKEGPGRPSYRYSLSGDAGGGISAHLRPDLGLVVLSFDGLRRLCRHEKGGYCKEIRGGCDSQKCPRIVR
jgi:predicted ArsR family transcriptional regulator